MHIPSIEYISRYYVETLNTYQIYIDLNDINNRYE